MQQPIISGIQNIYWIKQKIWNLETEPVKFTPLLKQSGNIKLFVRTYIAV